MQKGFCHIWFKKEFWIILVIATWKLTRNLNNAFNPWQIQYGTEGSAQNEFRYPPNYFETVLKYSEVANPTPRKQWEKLCDYLEHKIAV